MRKVALLLASSMLAASCDHDSPTGPVPLHRVLPGAWGGEVVSLSVSEGGAVFRAYCKEGDLDSSIVLDDRGRFDQMGTLLETGPAPIFHESARYTGRADARTMTLTVTVSPESLVSGPHELIFGRETTVTRCLSVAY